MNNVNSLGEFSVGCLFAIVFCANVAMDLMSSIFVCWGCCHKAHKLCDMKSQSTVAWFYRGSSSSH